MDAYDLFMQYGQTAPVQAMIRRTAKVFTLLFSECRQPINGDYFLRTNASLLADTEVERFAAVVRHQNVFLLVPKAV